MILCGILGIEATQWEEGVAAMLFLKNLEHHAGALESEAESRIKALVYGLRSLPENWARELAVEAASE